VLEGTERLTCIGAGISNETECVDFERQGYLFTDNDRKEKVDNARIAKG
jgi:hypothetical protein